MSSHYFDGGRQGKHKLVPQLCGWSSKRHSLFWLSTESLVGLSAMGDDISKRAVFSLKYKLRSRWGLCTVLASQDNENDSFPCVKKSESQGIFSFLPDRETRWFHAVMKTKAFTASSGTAVFPGDQCPHHICTQRPLALLRPPTFALPSKATYQPRAPPQLLFPACKMELEALDAWL